MTVQEHARRERVKTEKRLNARIAELLVCENQVERVNNEIKLIDSYFSDTVPHVFEYDVLRDFFYDVKKIIVGEEK